MSTSLLKVIFNYLFDKEIYWKLSQVKFGT